MSKTCNNQLEQVHHIFDILHGKAPADLLIKNLQILDVHGETVYDGSLLVDGGRIVALNQSQAKGSGLLPSQYRAGRTADQYRKPNHLL